VAHVLVKLRAVVPHRPLNLGESLAVAELQANLFLKHLEIIRPPLPETAISTLPLLQVERFSSLPVSGAAHWGKGRWMIVLNSNEPLYRQRFTLAHEFKHVLDAPFDKVIYPSIRGLEHDVIAERVADFFAACLLMPKSWLKRSWREVSNDPAVLARLFGVSQAAMKVRLESIGLVEPAGRCLAA
jgi:hypothetical protein